MFARYSSITQRASAHFTLFFPNLYSKVFSGRPVNLYGEAGGGAPRLCGDPGKHPAEGGGKKKNCVFLSVSQRSGA